MTPNFVRRARLHVGSAEHEFLVVSQKLIRPVTVEECRALGLAGAREADGGVSFTGRLGDLYRACLGVSTASRIYMTLATFRCGAVEELYRRVGRLPWELWLGTEGGYPEPEVHATARASRVGHEGLLAETTREAIVRRLSGLNLRPRSDEAIARILIRSRNNHCTVRIDCSGAPLHRRGYRLRSGVAPLREDLAAAVVRVARADAGPAYGEFTRAEPASAPDEWAFVDPMAGTGTLAIEAAFLMLGRGPGLGRSFAFQDWPSFKPGTFAAERRGLSGTASVPLVIAGDTDPDAVAAMRVNVEAAGLGGIVRVECTPSHELSLGSGPSAVLLVTNPPYGRRLHQGTAPEAPGWLPVLPGGVALAAYAVLPETRRPGTMVMRFRHGGIRAAVFRLPGSLSGKV